MVVGFYLINVGYVAFALRTSDTPNNLRQAIELVSDKIGMILLVLGVMHFLETYLASVFYVALPFGMVSPGSAVLFSGKLVMLLLLYMKEDAATVRQPIYGLLLGNALMVGLVLLLRLHAIAQFVGQLEKLDEILALRRDVAARYGGSEAGSMPRTLCKKRCSPRTATLDNFAAVRNGNCWLGCGRF